MRTNGDAVDEVFNHVHHERRRVVRILHRGQQKLVVVIPELRTLEWNKRVLNVRLTTSTLTEEDVDATLDGLLQRGCICARCTASLKQRVLAENDRTSNQAGRNVNASERREGCKAPVPVPQL
jgi:hypothetical protein